MTGVSGIPGVRRRRADRACRQEARGDAMKLDELKQILDIVREHELTEFELEQEGFKIKIRKDSSGVLTASGNHAGMPVPAQQLPAPAPARPVAPPQPVEAAAVAEAVETGAELAVVKSPIVGTFYRAPEPASPPFVEVGQRVKKAQVLCIIEAMKLMNEIESEYDGEIVSIYVENGQPVQYGERLFAIRR
jgi:acetyl-CoA carboxylase biotin carboxyl carrier protein